MTQCQTDGRIFKHVISGWFFIKPARGSTRANEALVIPALATNRGEVSPSFGGKAGIQQ